MGFLNLLIFHAAFAATPPPQLKPPLAGLVQMGSIGFHRQDGGLADNSLADLRKFPGVFGGTVINVTWEQLEPRPGEFDTKVIDRALADIRAYNQTNPQHPLGARLRVWPGPNAPVWAKNLGGPPVAIQHRDMPETVGRFWAPAYRQAWRNLQNRLAARYDTEPLIREVSNVSVSSMTDEIILLPGDLLSVKNLHAAGFTDQQFKACLLESPTDYAGWATTRLELVCNPYRTMDSGKPKADMGFTSKLMRQWRQMLGSRGVLSNHALNQPAEHADLYAEMRRLGPPIAFQTQAPYELDWEGALRLGLSYQAGSIELWTSAGKGRGFETKSPQTLQKWASWFH